MTTTITHIRDIPAHILLGHPCLRETQAHTALARTCRAFRAELLLMSTTVAMTSRDDAAPKDAVAHLCGLVRRSGLHLRALVWIDMYGVTDLAPLAALTGLKHLRCSWMDGVTDLAPLATLTGLQHLECSYMLGVPDLAPLAALTGLQHLDCSGMDAA